MNYCVRAKFLEIVNGDNKPNYSPYYLINAAVALIVICLVKLWWPKMIPFDLWEFWKIKGSLLSGLIASWPIFTWCVSVSIVLAILTRNDPDENRNAELHLTKGALKSLFAGVFEEISFRWLIFLQATLVVQITNWLFFGWLGFGIVEWLHLHWVGPIANWITFGTLESYIFGMGWAVGAGLLSSNIMFRDGHKYLGCIGLINSWFIGMFMFYLLFQFGLIVCILAHFIYDLLIFVVRYIDSVIKRANGRT